MIELNIQGLTHEDPETLLDLATLLTNIAKRNQRANERNKKYEDLKEPGEVEPTIIRTTLFNGPNVSGPVEQFTDEELIESELEVTDTVENVKVNKLFNPLPASLVETPDSRIVLASGNIQLDAEGLPWDRRIHSRTKSQLSDGTWRKQRGVDEKLIRTVEAELRQTMGASQAMTVVPPPPPAPVQPAIAVPPPPPPAVATPLTALANQVGVFSNFMKTVVTPAISQGKITHAQVTGIIQSVGVPSLPLLANRPDLIPQVTAAIQQITG